MKSEGGGTQQSVFEVETHAAVLRASAQASTLIITLTEALGAARLAGHDDIERQLTRVLEFHRLTSKRLLATVDHVEKRRTP